jgi:acetyl-CoA/propionyl-CoA carboxylase biotin carboxyl carrier protein
MTSDPRHELSPSQAAKRIGATTRSVQRWIAQGRLPARRVGGRWRVASDVLDAFDALEPGAPPPDGPRARPPERGWPAGIRAVFVANRGEIARRIEATCGRLGLRAIVPPTEGDAAVDLLDAAAVVRVATDAGADALHPGFGFLAENAEFAAAVAAAGIRWVGPGPDAIRAMGDKAAARRLAADLGIPTIPGYDGADQSDGALVAAAARIGAPVLVKPSAGGGGKGMRTVRDLATLPDAIAAARREARASFGDDRLILERFLEGPRHVEVQVLFDQHGGGVHLGERDCSVQRRHQKVLEETPSPAVDPDLRARLGEAALRLAAGVGYASAGTCEFLLDDRGRFYFLEMNTRLQVEHPVTELVTGRDLVADQLAIAGGATLAELGLSQEAADAACARGGHAVEVRLYAEDAEAGFLPATGRVEALHWPPTATRFGPPGPDGLRIDAGIEVGSEIGGRFDPMLAKVIAHGRDRQAAFERLERALADTVVLGLVTNLRFLRWLVGEPVVRDGEVRIDTLGRIWPPDDWPARSAIPDAAWPTAAAALVESADAAEGGATGSDPWAGGWRLNAPPAIRIATDDEARTVRPTEPDSAPDEPDATVARLAVRAGDTVHLDLGGRSVAFRVAPPPDVDRAARAAAAHAHGAGPAELVAPMPGQVLAVHAGVGATVAAGDPVVTLEAMKMEHVVTAPIAGRIADLAVRPADQVARGQALATVEP